MEISRLNKQDMEDRVHLLMTENTELKKQRSAQDEKMKRLATKILRLKSDMKKIQAGKPTKYTHDNDAIEELKMQLAKQEQELTTLRQKLLLARNLPPSPAARTRPSPVKGPGYGFVEPRIDTGLPYKPGGVVTPGRKKPRQKQFPGSVDRHGDRSGGGGYAGQALLHNARQEIEQLDEIVDQLRLEIQVKEGEKEELVARHQEMELSYENKLLSLREELVEKQRTGISEDIDVINLQRKIKEYEDRVGAGDSTAARSRAELSTAQRERDAALSEVAQLRAQVERLEGEVRRARARADDSLLEVQQAHELSIALEEVEREREILKQENSRLTEDVFSAEKERKYKENERALRDRIRQLEHRLERSKAAAGTQDEPGDRDELFDKYISERDRAAELEHGLSKLELLNKELSLALDRAQERLEEEERIRVAERSAALESAPATEQQQQSAEPTRMEVNPVLGPLGGPMLEVMSASEAERELRELQVEHAALVLELEKVNSLLEIQYRLKQEYQDEVASVTSKYERARREWLRREEEGAKLLDVRNHAINRLELQLRDIAYGTRQVRVEPPSGTGDNPADYAISLERGQNILEVHLGKMYTTDTPLLAPGDKLFLVLNFHHFEPAITKVVQGLEPDFNTTSQYVVTVDDFLLRCLQNGSAGLYLYSCNGTEFRCIGACQMKFKELLSQTTNSRIHGSLQILGTQGESSGVVFANVEYYLWFRFPVASSLRLFRERCKAGTYLSSNSAADSSHTQGESREQRPDGYNEVKVTVLNCTDVKGKNAKRQPSPYVVYKFYNFEDRATATIDSSNSPQFNDSHTYPLTTDHALHRYLSQAVCQLHLFDDSADGDGCYLGAADIPLLQLARGSNVGGSYECFSDSGERVGVVTVKMEWQLSYLPPSVDPPHDTPLRPDAIPRDKLATPDTGRHSVLPEDFERRPVYHESESQRRAREEGERAVLRAAERREGKQSSTALHVTFKLEDEELSSAAPGEESEGLPVHEASVVEEASGRGELMEVEEVEVPKTEFLSFRSLEEHDRAMKKAGKTSQGGLITEPDVPAVPDLPDVPDAVAVSSEVVQALSDSTLTSLSDDAPVDKPDPYETHAEAAAEAAAEIATAGAVEMGSEISESLTSISEEGSQIGSDVFQAPVLKAGPATAVASPPVTAVAGTPPEEPVREELGLTQQMEEQRQVLRNEFDDSSSEDEGVEELLSPAQLSDPLALSPAAQLSDPLALSPVQAGEERKGGLENTFFEEEPSEGDDDIVMPLSSAHSAEEEGETLEQITERMMSSDEDDDVIMTSSHDRDLFRALDTLGDTGVTESTPDQTPRAPPLVVIVHYLLFDASAGPFLADITQVFVEYKLLTIDPETETPGSVTVKPGAKLFFNFRKPFYIERGTADWSLLYDMMQPSAPSSEITFTVISDPGDDTDAMCVNLCEARTGIPRSGNLEEREIELTTEEGRRVGVICVTIESEGLLECVTGTGKKS